MESYSKRKYEARKISKVQSYTASSWLNGFVMEARSFQVISNGKPTKQPTYHHPLSLQLSREIIASQFLCWLALKRKLCKMKYLALTDFMKSQRLLAACILNSKNYSPIMSLCAFDCWLLIFQILLNYLHVIPKYAHIQASICIFPLYCIWCVVIGEVQSVGKRKCAAKVAAKGEWRIAPECRKRPSESFPRIVRYSLWICILWQRGWLGEGLKTRNSPPGYCERNLNSKQGALSICKLSCSRFCDRHL